MACSEVMIPQTNWNPPSAKIFKTTPILRIYIHPLFQKPLHLPVNLDLKLFNLPHLNKITINLSIQI